MNVLNQTISLKKGERISLAKAEPGVRKLLIGLGWAQRTDHGTDFDLDASVFLLNQNGQVDQPNDFIFYNPNFRKSGCGSVRHQGDNKIGSTGNDDCEQIEIDLDTLPDRIKKIVITITIFKAKARRQTFGDVKNAYARVVNLENEREIAIFRLTEQYGEENSLQMLEVFRHDNEWRVGTLGTGTINGLAGLCRNYGLDVEEE